MTSTAYRRIEEIWARGGVVILDGGVGSELERVGFPSARNIGELWGTVALEEAPDLAREVHRRYAEAGADVITTHTWRIDGVPVQDLGRVARLAVELAREGAGEAGRPDTAVAFSLWPEPAELGFVERLAEVLVETKPDLVLAETTETIPVDLRFPAFERLLQTGIPLWVSYRWTVDGPPDLRGQGIQPYGGALQEADGELLGRAAAVLEGLGAGAVLLNCLPVDFVSGALPLLRRHTSLPLGVYPNLGTYLDPGWLFDEASTPASYVEKAVVWRHEEGAQIVGGCCGTTPEHIAAVAAALRHLHP